MKRKEERDNTMVEKGNQAPKVKTKSLELLVEKLDLFSRPIPSFTVRSRTTISSPLGFCVSVGIIITVIILAVTIVIEFAGGENQYRTITNIEKDYFVGEKTPFMGVKLAIGF